MNICLVILSDGWGGAETATYELTRHLRDEGQNVSIILNDEIFKYYSKIENVKLFNVGHLFSPQSLVKLYLFPQKEGNAKHKRPSNRVALLLRSYMADIFTCIRLKQTRKEVLQFLSYNEIELIHSHLVDAAIMVSNLKNLEIPFVLTTHGEHYIRGVPQPHPLLIPQIKWKAKIFRQALEKADKIIDVSAYMIQVWQNWDHSLNKDKFTIIHNGVNLTEIQETTKLTLKEKGKFNLLFPGGAKFIKGGDLLVKSLPNVKKVIPDIHVYIALDVPQNSLLRKMVNDLDLEQNVTFVGFLQPEKYLETLNSVDALILPSRIEAFAITVIEAMALGKPVITSNTGGIPEIIKEGRNGILVEPEPDQIARAIIYLYENEGLRKKISQNNREDVINYDWKPIVKQYMAVYRELIEKAQTK